VGSGGREHALAWRLARDPDPPEIISAPGNDGIGRDFRRLAIGELEIEAIVTACREQSIDLAVIGPEAPLDLGLADALSAAGVAAFGPSREAARIESSKWYAKEIMARAGVPTARFESFQALEEARAALDHFDPPYVVKADGLAAGKGVRVTTERDEAEDFLAECLEGERFGQGGQRVVIEEYLEGEEVSVMAISDGRSFLLLPPAHDYKRARDGDRGANTGGMGAYSPVEWLDPALEKELALRIVTPTLATLEDAGTSFRGVLYCGLMLGPAGPRVLEFNCRFGDPETQVVLPLLEGSLGTLLMSAARGTLDANSIARRPAAAVTVALVDQAYPEGVSGTGVIAGLEELMKEGGVQVFHAGTSFRDGAWKVRGGRAAYVTASGGTRSEARARVYAAIARLGGEGWRYRHDIAADRDSAAARGQLTQHQSGEV
jgi:phosphoribosylamine--glycine ligase